MYIKCIAVLRISSDWKGVSFGVEHPLVQVDQTLIVAEEQVQVLERLTEEKRLHLVLGLRVVGVSHVVDRRVTAFFHLRRHQVYCNLSSINI